jgi:D-amino peptidase
MPKTKFMIRSDLEGVSGVVDYAQVEPGKPEFEFGLRMFKSDLCACLEGLQAGGADEIVIYDEHFYGRNIDAAWLPQGVSYIAGKPPYRADWAGGLDSDCAGLVMLGFHSNFARLDGLLHHTYEHDIFEMHLNGTPIGEIGMETAVAGDYGVPLVLVTADSAGCEEAEALVPGVKTVAVKQSLGATAGACHPLSLTSAWIREASAQVATTLPATKPWRCESPVTLQVSYNPGAYADAIRRLYPEDLNKQGDLVLHGETATSVWADHWQRKLKAQAEE